MPDNCNCIEHYCAGLEAGKAGNAPIVARIKWHELTQIAAHNLDTRFEGTYAVTIYHRPENKIFTGSRSWMLGMEILTGHCGLKVSRLRFEPDAAVDNYEYGLAED